MFFELLFNLLHLLFVEFACNIKYVFHFFEKKKFLMVKK